ncbi:hypothetical protein AQ505_05980 [Pedobacter sp. PACM 27299]|uniref:hypothetical protein n=1 Tax=Pedobacter sp. PACM 27299 TaxID=1727164 RepID=UPI000705FFE1|nr:hypothetical protein [Pedobacter sp. PACM 27299]ALL05083.1 hypothetical protein AQ505_05980 [Pedobacter sp. PACM 27299]
MSTTPVKVHKLPRLALLLANHDRALFYRKLNETGDAFLIEEDRHWLINSPNLITQLFHEPSLDSNRQNLKKLLIGQGTPDSINFFYQNWLMYMSGAEHQFWREKFIACFPKRMELSYKYFDMANAIGTSIKEFDLIKQVINPYVVHMLCEIAGMKVTAFQNAYHLINPILQLLHGRGQVDNPTTKHNALDEWSTIIERLTREQKLTKQGFLSQLAKTGKLGLAVGLLPFLDVVDALIALCGRVVIDYAALKQQQNIKIQQEKLLDLIKLYSPFQVCNRKVINPITHFPELDFQYGDKVSLMIGAANSNTPKRDVAEIQSIPNLKNFSFGIGQHSCPGRNWSITIVMEFYKSLDNYLTEYKASIKVKNINHREEFGFQGIQNMIVLLKLP